MDKCSDDCKAEEILKSLKENNSTNYRIKIANETGVQGNLGAHRFYGNGDYLDDDNTFVMTHSSEIESQKWEIKNIKEDIFEIIQRDPCYNQNGWKLAVQTNLGKNLNDRLILSQTFTSEFRLIPKGNFFEIQEVSSEDNVTIHKDELYRDYNSNYAYLANPGMSGCVWNIVKYEEDAFCQEDLEEGGLFG